MVVDYRRLLTICSQHGLNTIRYLGVFTPLSRFGPNTIPKPDSVCIGQPKPRNP